MSYRPSLIAAANFSSGIKAIVRRFGQQNGALKSIAAMRLGRKIHKSSWFSKVTANSSSSMTAFRYAERYALGKLDYGFPMRRRSRNGQMLRFCR